ncbi:uncharacterized protein PFLUO_LOCUS6713 [Penicillium psychrofluorescens]|uniref:uncharacterized protein n=1 Tax=Penicillium psychrofluorescens TaxID=3158075 RepID=UPI003CCCA09A
MVRNIHVAVLDVDIPARILYEARGLCSAHFRNILQETAGQINESDLASDNPINISVTPYDIRGGHYPDFRKMRGHLDQIQWPETSPIDAILITGGAPGVYEMDKSPWMQTLAKFLRTIYDQYPKVRILGTCFGHQLISHVLVHDPKDSVRDVFVEICPLGREVGIYTVQLEDAFIRSFPEALGHLSQGQLRIQMFHGDRVMAVEKGQAVTLTDSPPVSLPAPWINVGSTPICPIQGLYHPGRVLSVQGHYELDAFGMQMMCLDSAPRMQWKQSKLALFLEQIGPDFEERQNDAKAFASAVVYFLAGVEF